jgi:hypothetical protein
MNNTYDQEVFTQRAVQRIHEHAAAAQIQRDTPGDAPVEPMFLYLAYHNVHDACTKEKALNAPLETVEMYETTKLDTWKLQGMGRVHTGAG